MDYKEALAKSIATELCSEAKATINPEDWELDEENYSMPDWAASVLTTCEILFERGFDQEAAEIIAALSLALGKAPKRIKLAIMSEILCQLTTKKGGLSLASVLGGLDE